MFVLRLDVVEVDVDVIVAIGCNVHVIKSPKRAKTRESRGLLDIGIDPGKIHSFCLVVRGNRLAQCTGQESL